MTNESICYVCGSKASFNKDSDESFYTCPVCGRYQIFDSDLNEFNLNHLSAYLVYNGFRHGANEYRYFTTISKEKLDKYHNDFKNGITEHGNPIQLKKEDIENWYPKTFSEKIDLILLYLNSKIQHLGEYIELNMEEALSCFFIDRYDFVCGKYQKRNKDFLKSEFKYIFNYFEDQQLIIHKNFSDENMNNLRTAYTLTPKAYNRIDELQKHNTNSKQVLVAMKFGDDTKKLRESVREGITAAGYKAIYIDEVQHNDFITPELLKYIKDSRFVVVDLSHQNNGAYFEEGYAMGLGKPVIQLCKEGVKLHFDIAQKNTIIWQSEEEIAERLKNRIKATID